MRTLDLDFLSVVVFKGRSDDSSFKEASISFWASRASAASTCDDHDILESSIDVVSFVTGSPTPGTLPRLE